MDDKERVRVNGVKVLSDERKVQFTGRDRKTAAVSLPGFANFFPKARNPVAIVNYTVELDGTKLWIVKIVEENEE